MGGWGPSGTLPQWSGTQLGALSCAYALRDPAVWLWTSSCLLASESTVRANRGVFRSERPRAQRSACVLSLDTHNALQSGQHVISSWERGTEARRGRLFRWSWNVNSNGESLASRDTPSSLPAGPPPAPSPEGARSPFPQRAPAGAPGGPAASRGCRPGADLALYQGSRSRAIWPHSCPGGLTSPAPFQGNPTPGPGRSLPHSWPGRLPAPQQRPEGGELATVLSLPVLGTEPQLAVGLWGQGTGLGSPFLGLLVH